MMMTRDNEGNEIDMADNFIGFEQIVIQPQDVDIGHLFDFTVSSSTTANDGFLPPGAVIEIAEVIGIDETGGTIPGLVSGFEIVDETNIEVALSYPGESYEGMAGIRFILHLLGCTTEKEADFTRINIRNIGFI